MDFFEIIAECSVALAGFGAVHAVLRGATNPRGAFRAWTVVVQGAVSFVLSVLPLVLTLTSLSNESLWRSVSAVGLVATSATAYSFIVFDIRMTRLGHPPQALASIRIAQLFAIASILALLANFIGWPWQPGPFLYAVALILVLITGLVALLHAFILPVLLVFDGKDVESPQEPNGAMANDESTFSDSSQ